MTMNPERKTAFTISGFMHLVMVLFAIFGLPAIFEMTRDPEPQAITVELLPISAISNVKNNPNPPKEIQKPEETKAEEKPKEEDKPVEKPKEKPVPPVKKEEKSIDEILKVSEKADQKKKPDEQKKKDKKVEDDLDAILKSVEKSANKASSESKDEKKEKESASDSKSKSDNYNPDLPLSISQMDMIRSQLAKCWNVPAGAKDAENLIVIVQAQFNADGTVIDAKLKKDKGRYASDGYFRAAADSAIRAVHKCSPLQNLPADKFQTWKDMELTFDPKTMLY